MTAARRCVGLPPVLGAAPRVLVLGSMPGAESLRRWQYYAHPRNQLWPILGELVGAGRELPYARRLARLRAARIALWDVARTCLRDASADATIADVVPNDFVALLRKAPSIERVLCNGGKAFDMFTRLVLPGLEHASLARPAVRLPSTSAAHAARDYAAKLAAWRAALSAASRRLSGP